MKTVPLNRDSFRERSISNMEKEKTDGSTTHTNYLSNFSINNMNILKTDENLKTIWQESLNCLTLENNNKNPRYCADNILLMQGMDVEKKRRSQIFDSETSEEDLSDGIKETLIEKCINKTLTGWDDRGIHYWLSNMNRAGPDYGSLRDVSVPINWLHIHACEECFNSLNAECDFFTASNFCLPNHLNIASCNDCNGPFGENRFSLPYKPIGCFDGLNTTYNYDDEQSKVIDKMSHGKREEQHNTKKCSEQYFRRVMYTYNACGLQFQYPENRMISMDEEDEPVVPQLNPFVKVVVYGTDPCALNFPVELGDPEESINGFTKSISSCYPLETESSFHSTEENVSVKSLDLFEDEPYLSASQDSQSFSSQNNENYIESNSQENNLNKSSYFPQIVSSHELPNNNEETSHSFNVNDNLGFKDEMFYDVLSMASFNKNNLDSSNSYSTVKSMSDLNMSGSGVLGPDSCNPLFPGRGRSRNNPNISILPGNLRKIYNAHYPCRGKVFEFSVYDGDLPSRTRNNSAYYRTGRRVKRKKKAPVCLELPGCIPLKVRFLNIGPNIEDILVRRSSSLLHLARSKSETQYCKVPILLQICIYILFFAFFVIAFMLVEETMHFATTVHETPPSQRISYFNWF